MLCSKPRSSLRWSSYRGNCRWYRLVHRACLSGRDRSKGDPWSRGLLAAVGHHMVCLNQYMAKTITYISKGYSHPVLRPVRRVLR
jgi:hypothetical protein